VLQGAVLTVIAYPLLLAWAAYRLVRDPASRARTFSIAVFAIYLIEVARVTLFPIPLDRAIIDTYMPSWVTPANFALFDRMGTTAQVQGNILMGAPFGLLAWFVLRKRSTVRVLLVGAGTFAAVELSQLLIGMVIGVPYRILDINDLVLNTGGVLIGIVAFLIIRLLFRIIDPRIGDQSGPYLSYARSIMTPESTPVAPTSDSHPSLP
jgi:glycopeptide antibiotics resistance protein